MQAMFQARRTSAVSIRSLMAQPTIRRLIDTERVAEIDDGLFDFHRIDPLEPLFGGSERMPNVFFKMSGC